MLNEIHANSAQVICGIKALTCIDIWNKNKENRSVHLPHKCHIKNIVTARGQNLFIFQSWSRFNQYLTPTMRLHWINHQRSVERSEYIHIITCEERVLFNNRVRHFQEVTEKNNKTRMIIIIIVLENNSNVYNNNW